MGKIFMIGKQPMNGSITAYYNAIKSEHVPAADRQLRIQLALLFPK